MELVAITPDSTVLTQELWDVTSMRPPVSPPHQPFPSHHHRLQQFIAEASVNLGSWGESMKLRPMQPVTDNH